VLNETNTRFSEMLSLHVPVCHWLVIACPSFLHPIRSEVAMECGLSVMTALAAVSDLFQACFWLMLAVPPFVIVSSQL
jgi:hypothetical protein